MGQRLIKIDYAVEVIVLCIALSVAKFIAVVGSGNIIALLICVTLIAVEILILLSNRTILAIVLLCIFILSSWFFFYPVIPALLSVVLIHLLKIKNDKGGNDTQEKLIPAARVNTKILFAVCMIAVGFTLFYSIVNMSRYYFGYDSEIYSFGEDETIRTVYIVSILLCAVSLVLLLARLIDKKMRLKRWFIVATIVSYSESIILGLIANIGGLLNYALMIGVPAIYMLLLFERIERKGRI